MNTNLIQPLANWLADYATEAGKKLFIVVYDGTRASGLVLKICSEATAIKKGLSTICLYDHKESAPSFFLGRSYEVVNSIPSTVPNFDYITANKWADDRDGIVVSSIEKTFGKYNRSYSKFTYSMCDVFPLYDLYYSDIVLITDALWPEYKWKDNGVDDQKMLEFCGRAENSFGIITSADPPHKHKMWPTFTSTQKKFIAETHQREKKTRHKDVKKPYPNIGLYNGKK